MCILKIFSDTSSFKRFALATKLEVVSAYDKGEMRGVTKKPPAEQYQITLSVSDAEWDDFKLQVSDAIIFLTSNHDELLMLHSTHEVIDGYLDFPIESRLDGDIAVQCDHLPKQLIKLASNFDFGILMSIYE